MPYYVGIDRKIFFGVPNFVVIIWKGWSNSFLFSLGFASNHSPFPIHLSLHFPAKTLTVEKKSKKRNREPLTLWSGLR